MKHFICLAAVVPLLACCSTIHVDRSVRDAAPGTVQTAIRDELPLIFEPAVTVVEIEKPVYVPLQSDQAQRPPPSGAAAVRESNGAGIVHPSEYSRAAMVYDYHPDYVYEVYTQPLRASDILLEPGERAVEPPFISDSDRWMLGAGVSYSYGQAVQHIYVKPTEQSLEASLIINTDRRVYHIILRSFRDVHMPMIRWRYPASGMPNSYIPQPGVSGPQDGPPGAGVDPRFLSFNYKITYGLFQKPAWLPELVFDDGQKTYIAFPESALQRELPAVFENRRDVLNYRVVGKVMIIDKLIENITVKLEKKEIDIAKKRG
jgi:type IV secretion system protein VirB9